MSEDSRSINQVARELRLALETADLSIFGDLLDEKVTWGPPGDPSPPCRSKEGVLAWYERGKLAGGNASVSEVDVIGNQILVGLAIRGIPRARQQGGQAAHWQIYTVRDGHVIDIVGFGQKSEATDWLSKA